MIAVERWSRIAGRCWLALTASVLAGLVALAVLGAELRSVDTGSMDPTVPRGSLAIVHPVSPGAIEVGDVISFTAPLGGPGAGRRVLHRVVAVRSTEQGRFFETQGDANPTPDLSTVHAGGVDGRLGAHFPHVGRVAALARPPAGVVLLALPPVLLLGLHELGRRRTAPRSSGSHEAAAETVSV